MLTQRYHKTNEIKQTQKITLKSQLHNNKQWKLDSINIFRSHIDWSNNIE